MSVDETDLELLRLLSIDAASSKRGLARDLGMSAPAVGERVARLEREGVIRRYTIDIDWELLGYSVNAYIAMTVVQGKKQQKVVDALLELPEVKEVSVTTSEIDILAHIIVRDHAALRELIIDRIWEIDGVERTNTMLSVIQASSEAFVPSLIASIKEQRSQGA